MQYVFMLPDGRKVSVECYERRKPDHTIQIAESIGARGTATYGNRPWEAFEYEKALRKWAEAYAKGDAELRACLTSQINEIEAGIARDTEEYLKRFKERWDKVDPDLKKRTAKVLNETGHVVGSEEEGEAILKMAEAFTALKKLGA